jgi:hypothetical protein|tara:strand:+ start:19594 stop:19758 length:165 start_codon:yes stop_codon:yes gene_type:complete
MDKFKRASMHYVGWGGVGCPCCNSLFGKLRKKLRKLARKRLKNKLEKKIKYLDF